ncbi:MAG: S8 family serine peptidase [Prolixibacteraceae bacterium]|nr:S8 family serine peptidase [Prolixibacteraceae bacterium]
MKKSEAERWAVRNNKPIRFTSDRVFYELQYISDDSIPQYYRTTNVNAAATILTNKVHPSGGLGLSLTGSGMTVHEWDGGSALTTHQEFGSRVTVGDGSSDNFHATHVAGTIMASGVDPNAKGMAYQADLRSFDWNSDVSEMATEAASGALVSNHSYGYNRGWYYSSSGDWIWYGNTSISTTEDYRFGFYDSNSENWDIIANYAPYYLICKAAGNDRGEYPGAGAPYPPDGPYDCIGQLGVAKNILTIGAVNDIPGGYTGPSDVVMSSFSSWGPADDGRIKPDIVANGVGLYSTYNSGNDSYASMNGTSMATPSVTGSLVLLQQHYNNLNSSYMLASTLKALVIHTADEAGPNDGPDYMNGWGLMNTAKAANLITTNQNNNVISEHLLSTGSSYTRDVVANGSEPLKATIVWNDPSGTPPQASLDPSTPMLVNDLDLRITQSQNTFYPWKLDRDNEGNAATNATKNDVDNVEVVFISNPVQGETYTITVDHDGSLSGGSQVFSLIVSGIEPSVGPDANFTADNTLPLIDETVSFTDLSTNIPTSWSWSISPTTFSYVEGTSANSQNPKVAFEAEGDYTVSLTVTNAQGNDTETKVNYISVQGCGIFSLPFYESFEDGQVPPDCWTSIDNDGDGYGWDIGSTGYAPFDGTYIALSESWNDTPLTPDNWLITPQLALTTDSVTLKYAIKAQDPDWIEEKYSVLYSTTGNNIGDFNHITTQTISTTDWMNITITLTGFSGQNVYFAFRHWDCTDWYQLVLDHIRVEEYGVPEDYTVADVVLSDGESDCFNATNTLTVAGGGTTVELMSGSSATFIAGGNIRFLPGFHAHSGSEMDAHITTDDTFCDQLLSPTSTALATYSMKSTTVNQTETEFKKQDLSQKTIKNIQVYPNPTSGLFNVELHNFEKPVQLMVFNQQGAVVLKTEKGIANKATFDLSNAPKGMYVVKVADQNEFFTRKIMLE